MEVLLHTFHSNFGQAEEYRSLNRGVCYIEVSYLKFPNIAQLLTVTLFLARTTAVLKIEITNVA